MTVPPAVGLKTTGHHRTDYRTPEISCKLYRDRKFVLPQKSAPKFTKIFRGCYPLKPPIVPIFIKILKVTVFITAFNWNVTSSF